jgi:hypothetical protein
MVIKVFGEGLPQRTEYIKNKPESAPTQQLSVSGNKPPLVFPGVTIPKSTQSDQEWHHKFDNYVRRKKNRKCALMLEIAAKEDNFWRIAYALETRHQHSDPDSVFTLYNQTSFRTDLTLDDCLWFSSVSCQAKEMIINAFYPKRHTEVSLKTLTSFHRDTLMTWAEQANQTLLNSIFLATIYAGKADDIVKLCDMGADINCTYNAPGKDGATAFFRPLRSAVSRQDNDILKLLITLEANIFSEFDLLVEWAYKSGCLDMVKTLKDERETQESGAGLRPKTDTNTQENTNTDGWTALSATFAEYSRPQGATGLQLTYQVDFDARLVSCVYEKDNCISAPTIIPLSQLEDPKLLQKAADVIEQGGYPRPDIEQAFNTLSRRAPIKTITAAVAPNQGSKALKGSRP